METGNSGENKNLAVSEKSDFTPIDQWGLSPAKDAWISYCAVGGLITGPDGTIKKMSIREFCDQFDTDDTSIYRWKKTIPEFSEKVRQRRKELYTESRESNMWNRLYMIAMSSKDHKAAVLAITSLQGHFAKLELPKQRAEVNHKLDGGIADLLLAHRNTNPPDRKVIEADVADATSNT